MKRVKKYTKTKRNPNKVQVTFTEEQREILKSLRGDYGNTEAEVVRNLVLQHEIVREKIKRKHEGYSIQSPRSTS